MHLRNPVRRPELVLINAKKRTCHLANFALPADHKLKVNAKNFFVTLCGYFVTTRSHMRNRITVSVSF